MDLIRGCRVESIRCCCCLRPYYAFLCVNHRPACTGVHPGSFYMCVWYSAAAYFIHSYVCVNVCPHVDHVHAVSAWRGQKCYSPYKWISKQFWVIMWVLEPESWSSKRTVSDFNPELSSAQPCVQFSNCIANTLPRGWLEQEYRWLVNCSPRYLKNFFNSHSFYVYEYFAYMHIYVPNAFLVPGEARRGCQMP